MLIFVNSLSVTTVLLFIQSSSYLIFFVQSLFNDLNNFMFSRFEVHLRKYADNLHSPS